MKDIDQFDEIRNLLKDKEDSSYKIIDKLVDLLEKQQKEITDLKNYGMFRREIGAKH